MTQSATDQIYEYWRSIMRDGGIPDRSGMNPMDVGSLLPKIFMLQLEKPGRDDRIGFSPSMPEITFRLAGTELDDTHMRDLVRTPFRNIFAAKNREWVDQETMRVFADREIKVFHSRIQSKFAIVDVETILLPMSNGEEGCTRALGCQRLMVDNLKTLWWRGSYQVSDHALMSVSERLWREERPANVIGDPRLQPPAYEVPVFELSRRARRPEGRMVGHLVVIEGGAGQRENA
jgi:hypothetical protein